MTLRRGRIETAIAEALPRNGDVGVAVSGGSDSTALLHGAARVVAGTDRTLRAVTVDHGLRPESADEARYVGDLCGAFGIVHETLAWRDGGTGNLQARARDARYALLAEWARTHGLATILLGHTMDDQAETFVMRLRRRAGVDGLAAMSDRVVRDGIEFRRPLLGLRRAELREYLEASDIAWCDDPSNDDMRYERARARRVLSALDGLGIDTGDLAAVSSHLADARRSLAQVAADAAAQAVRQDRGDLVFDRATFEALSDDTRRRLLQGAIRWIGGAGYSARQTGLRQLAQAVAAAEPATLGGCLCRPEAGGFRIAREWRAVADLTVAPGDVWDGRWRIDGGAAVAGMRVAALGSAGVDLLPDWRESGLPRTSLAASPAIWNGDGLIAAPLARCDGGWAARLVPGRDDFPCSLRSH